VREAEVDEMERIANEQRFRSICADGLGVVFNDFSGHGASGAQYNVVHAATCRWLARSNLSVPKIWFEDLVTATSWLERERGLEGRAWKRCGIGKAFEHVAVSARLKVATVAEATRPELEGSDVLARARMSRERDQAALRVAKDRDLGRLEATMARLDAEAEAAVVRPSRVPTAAEARAFLESLPDLWAKTSDAGRHAIAEAVFERIDILGVADYAFTLTARAKAHGWDVAFGGGVVRAKEGRSGPGERSSADTFQLSVCIDPGPGGHPARLAVPACRRPSRLPSRSA
jgi:hypothetical protein